MNIGAGPAIGNACSIDATDLNQKDNENSSNTGTTDQGRESNVSQNIHSTQVCSTAMQQGMNSSFPGNIQERTNRDEDQQHSVLMLNLPGPPHYKALMPATLPGTRCYTDASIAPDNFLQVSSSAGLGIFIVNNLPGAASTIFIKAKQRGCNSVIMAEAAALALGAQFLNALHVHQPFFL